MRRQLSPPCGHAVALALGSNGAKTGCEQSQQSKLSKARSIDPDYRKPVAIAEMLTALRS
jgi:hypothetical protein